MLAYWVDFDKSSIKIRFCLIFIAYKKLCLFDICVFFDTETKSEIRFSVIEFQSFVKLVRLGYISTLRMKKKTDFRFGFSVENDTT